MITLSIFVISFVTPSHGAGVNQNGFSGKDPGMTEEHDILNPNARCPLSSSDLEAAAAYLKFKKIKASHIPSGIPGDYGKELNISFDQVQDAINKVRIFGPTYGKEGQKITLTDENLKRYINIGSQISCQYCCNAKTLVREDGKAACGCAHSIMMRGLASYLIENHPELSDERILEELNTWKIAYFPKQTLTAKLGELEKAGDDGIKEILKEFPDFLPKMVGGC
jgi:hypothetical protein